MSEDLKRAGGGESLVMIRLLNGSRRSRTKRRGVVLAGSPPLEGQDIEELLLPYL